MTSLRDIFKKTKKTAKETTNKILDADIEENVAKVGEATASGIPYIGKALKIIFFIFVPITVIALLFHSFIENYTENKWCNNTYHNIFNNQKVHQKLDLREVRELTKIARDYNCYVYIKDEDNEPIISFSSWIFYLDGVERSVMTDEEKENNKSIYEILNPENKSEDSFKLIKPRKLIITNPGTWGQETKKSYQNKTNKQLLDELNQLTRDM